MRLSLLPALALFVLACDVPRAPSPIVPASHNAPLPPTPAAASTTVPVAPEPAPSDTPAEAPAPRAGGPTAVILFGTSGLTPAERLRFVPVLCSIQGKLTTGKACGEAMPTRAKVKSVRADAKLPPVLAVTRSTRDYHDENGNHLYRAPAGPACCMYNTCVEETIPYLPVAQPTANAKAVLAVWPETADVGLKPAPLAVDPTAAAASPWPGKPDAKVEQAIRVGARRLVSGRSAPRCMSCTELWFDDGRGFSRVGGIGMGADGYEILGTSDIDGDGRPEAIVHERWRNDYGLHVLGNDWSKAAYRYSCGNI